MNPLQVDQSHFTMMKVVGKGGFGKVNAVTHRVSGQLMAMKRMKKSRLIAKKMYIVTAWRERDVMAQLKSPFLVNLLYAFQDKHHLFLIMPFMPGGDLRYFLSTKGRMPEDWARFYAAEIVLGLEELHSLNVVYRDLKPDNVLLDADGHLRISDFGLAVILSESNKFQITGGAGTPGYQAPEILLRQPYGKPADLFSLGITIYEFLERQRPFAKPDDCLAPHRVGFHTDVSPECKSFIRGLLIPDPSKRLGAGPRGFDDIKEHPWFHGLDWVKLNAREISPPFQPELDRANCSADFELQDQFFSEKKEAEIDESLQANFVGFEFNVRPTGSGEDGADVTMELGEENLLAVRHLRLADPDDEQHHGERKDSGASEFNSGTGVPTAVVYPESSFEPHSQNGSHTARKSTVVVKRKHTRSASSVSQDMSGLASTSRVTLNGGVASVKPRPTVSEVVPINIQPSPSKANLHRSESQAVPAASTVPSADLISPTPLIPVEDHRSPKLQHSKGLSLVHATPPHQAESEAVHVNVQVQDQERVEVQVRVNVPTLPNEALAEESILSEH